MPTTQTTAAGYFIRPVRPDVLQRAGFRLRSHLISAGASRPDAGQLARGVVAMARITRAYLDGIRELQRVRGPVRAERVLESLRRVTLQLRDRIEAMAPALARTLEVSGDGEEAAELLETWFQGGGPQELTAEGRLRHALSERLASLGPVRVSDIAHLACLWSDSQRFHAALRGVLSASTPSRGEGTAFLEASSRTLKDHVLPVDLDGLPGDPGLLEGIPAMISRLGSSPGRRSGR